MASQSTPTRGVIPGLQAPRLETSIRENQKSKIIKCSVLWGSFNLGLLSIVLYDLQASTVTMMNSCPNYMSYVQYTEYVCAIIFTLNIIYHLARYIKVSIVSRQITPVTWQKKDDTLSKQGSPTISALSSSTLKPAPLTPMNLSATPMNLSATPLNLSAIPMNLSATPMNLTATSWMATGQSYSPSRLEATRPSPHVQTPMQNISPILTSRRDTSGIDFITDEQDLNVYLKDFEANEKVVGLTNSIEQPANALSSFWSHPMAKTVKDVSEFLKKCQYQLSSPVGSVSFNYCYILSPCDLPNYYYGKFPRPFHLFTSNSPKYDNKASAIKRQSIGIDTWRRLNVDSVALTQWNANLRMWISQTILSRLVKEFEIIDDALQKQGFIDIQIGKVGLERLRKTAQTAPILQFIPTLPTILPFLELTTNQEYLVGRISELAKGGCMSDFKWNSGSNYNGKDWDQSLPCDSAIVMHLFASYLDTQLMPVPNHPDTKPFTGFHFIKVNEKPTQLTNSTFAIQQVVEYPPHYRVIIGEQIFELVNGYNNLFHSILLFLYYINKREHGMLGRVNLGRSGVNMLWIIQS